MTLLRARGRGYRREGAEKATPEFWVRSGYTGQALDLPALQKGSDKQTERRFHALVGC